MDIHLYIGVCIYIYECIYLCIDTNNHYYDIRLQGRVISKVMSYLYMHMCRYEYECIWTYIYINAYICIYTWPLYCCQISGMNYFKGDGYMNICIYMYVYICTYLWIYICTQIHMCIYVNIHQFCIYIDSSYLAFRLQRLIISSPHQRP
jgi:hypothetical protein